MDDVTPQIPEPVAAPEPEPSPEPEVQPQGDGAEPPAHREAEPDPAFAARRYQAQRDREREQNRILQEQVAAQRQQTEALIKLVERVAPPDRPAADQPAGDPYAPRPGEENDQYLARVLQQLVTDVSETRQERAQRLQREAEAQKYEGFRAAVAQEYSQYAKTEAPDLLEAANFLTEPLQKQLRKLGASTQEIQAEIDRRELQYVALARRRGINPGQMIYEAAVAEGYVPAAERAQREEAAKKRAKAESARGIGGGGSGATPANKASLVDAFNKAPPGSPARAKLMKDILTP